MTTASPFKTVPTTCAPGEYATVIDGRGAVLECLRPPRTIAAEIVASTNRAIFQEEVKSELLFVATMIVWVTFFTAVALAGRRLFGKSK